MSGQLPSSSSLTNPPAAAAAATSSTPSPRPYVDLSYLPVRFRPTQDPWVEGSGTSGRLTPPPPPRPLPLPAPASSPEPQESHDSDDEDDEDEPIEERQGYVAPLEAYVDKDAGRGYLYLKTLSAGDQGTIIKVLAIDEDWEDEREIVLKIFSSENKASWLQEVQGYERVSNPGHPNVLKYYGGFYYCHQRCIALDLADT
ncbi:hypothetical protein BGX30_001112, partial [Mortierella sp. GBA39]